MPAVPAKPTPQLSFGSTLDGKVFSGVAKEGILGFTYDLDGDGVPDRELTFGRNNLLPLQGNDSHPILSVPLVEARGRRSASLAAKLRTTEPTEETRNSPQFIQ